MEVFIDGTNRGESRTGAKPDLRSRKEKRTIGRRHYARRHFQNARSRKGAACLRRWSAIVRRKPRPGSAREDSIVAVRRALAFRGPVTAEQGSPRPATLRTFPQRRFVGARSRHEPDRRRRGTAPTRPAGSERGGRGEQDRVRARDLAGAN